MAYSRLQNDQCQVLLAEHCNWNIQLCFKQVLTVHILLHMALARLVTSTCYLSNAGKFVKLLKLFNLLAMVMGKQRWD